MYCIARNVCGDYILWFVVEKEVCGFNACGFWTDRFILIIYISSLRQQQTLCHCDAQCVGSLLSTKYRHYLLGLVTAILFYNILFTWQSRVLPSKREWPSAFVGRLITSGISTLFWHWSCSSTKYCFSSRRAVDSGTVKCYDAFVFLCSAACLPIRARSSAE